MSDSDQPFAVDFDALLPRAIEVTRAAAVPVMAMFRSKKGVWQKSADGSLQSTSQEQTSIKNPVTEADLAADAILREGLLAALPGSGWLSEETKDEPSRLGCRATWVVDPIDGTREYVEGVDQFAVSVALVVDGAPALAVMLNPARDELYTAVAGRGAFLGDVRLRASARSSLDGGTLLASRSESRRGEFDPFRERLEILDLGSTAWKLARLAAGQGDAYFTRKPRNEWDIAAGVLLCSEAGARVTDLHRKPHQFNRPDPLVAGIVASSVGVHDELMDLLDSVGNLL